MDVLLFLWSHSKWVSFVGHNAWDGNLFFFLCLSMPFRLYFRINCKRCLWNESLALFFWLRLTFPLCAPLAIAISIVSVLPMVVVLEMGSLFLFLSVSFRSTTVGDHVGIPGVVLLFWWMIFYLWMFFCFYGHIPNGFHLLVATLEMGAFFSSFVFPCPLVFILK